MDRAEEMVRLFTRSIVSATAMGEAGNPLVLALFQYQNAYMAAFASFRKAHQARNLEPNPILAHQEQLLMTMAALEKEVQAARLT